MDSARTRTAARILRFIPRERITRALGHLTEAQLPAAILNPVLRIYTRAYRVDMGEAVTPTEGFGSFNEFFTRRLREGLRPIDADPDAIVSPADGRLDDLGAIDANRAFVVKGQEYTCAELLGSHEDAEAFADGSFAVVYLSPRDYHRVHAPVGGVVRKARHIPGTLFPVNAVGVRHVPLLFARNERVVTLVETEAFGRIAVVMVGAMIVGKISLAFEAPTRPVLGGTAIERFYDGDGVPALAKGAELGAFLLGSTVVILLQRPPRGRYEFPGDVVGTQVRVGQSIARRSDG
jgi:phosphatidylserine decarboxylase